jgi:hypothetical protein
MRVPGPIEVIDLFPDLQDELLKLLTMLSHKDWDRPTSNPKWSVKDIVSHLICDDLRRLSSQRERSMIRKQ